MTLKKTLPGRPNPTGLSTSARCAAYGVGALKGRGVKSAAPMMPRIALSGSDMIGGLITGLGHGVWHPPTADQVPAQSTPAKGGPSTRVSCRVSPGLAPIESTMSRPPR